MKPDFSDISAMFDEALIASIGQDIAGLREACEIVRNRLLAKYSGNAFAEVEVWKCELERLLVGSIKLECDWMVSFEIYKQRRPMGFQDPVRHFLLLRWLLNAEIMPDKKEEILALCHELSEELRNVKDGCERSLEQLTERIRGIRD